MRPVTSSASSEDTLNRTSIPAAKPLHDAAGSVHEVMPVIPGTSRPCDLSSRQALALENMLRINNKDLDLLLARINLLRKLDALPVFFGTAYAYW